MRVKGHSNLSKKEQGVVVNTNKTAYAEAMKRKEKEKRFEEMENRLSRIEQLLERLIDD